MTSRELEPAEPESHHAPSAGELRKILHQLVENQHQTTRHLTRLDKKMTDGLANLQQSVTDLQTTDNAVLAALGGGVQQLQAQLAQAQSDLAAAQATDASDVAARDAALAQVAQAQSDAQAAADSIEAEVSKLNAADGSTPPAPAA